MAECIGTVPKCLGSRGRRSSVRNGCVRNQSAQASQVFIEPSSKVLESCSENLFYMLEDIGVVQQDVAKMKVNIESCSLCLYSYHATFVKTCIDKALRVKQAQEVNMQMLYRIPDELLSHIFLLACYKQDDDFGIVNDESSISSFCLACRRFHDVIISNSSFWSSIYLHADIGRITERRVSLAQNRPLEVTISSLHPWGGLDAIIKKSHQWRRLNFLFFLDTTHIFELYPNLDLDAVQCLSIVFDDSDISMSRFYSEWSFRNVKVLSFSGNNLRGELPPANSFPHLQELSVRGLVYQPRNIITFLRTTPSLRSLETKACYCDFEEEETIAALSLMALENLRIEWDSLYDSDSLYCGSLRFPI